MLKIGDFSKLSMVSIRMLRYYDEQGILSPATIDKFTGYRYYSVSQLAEISKIKMLQNMGISLSEIKYLQKHSFDEKLIMDALETCIEKKEKELSLIELQMKNLHKTKHSLERKDYFMAEYNVELKTIPKRKVAYLSEVIKEYKDEGELWKKLYSTLGKNHIEIKSKCLPMAVYEDAEYKDENPMIEVNVDVNEKFLDLGAVKFKETEEITAATVTFTGFYDRITDIYRAIASYIETNGYDFSGKMFLQYITSPSEVKSPDELVSMLCVPVTKK